MDYVVEEIRAGARQNERRFNESIRNGKLKSIVSFFDFVGFYRTINTFTMLAIQILIIFHIYLAPSEDFLTPGQVK